jgi:hypothetical protein
MAKMVQKRVALKWAGEIIGTCTVEMEVNSGLEGGSFEVKDIEPEWINEVFKAPIDDFGFSIRKVTPEQ